MGAAAVRRNPRTEEVPAERLWLVRDNRDKARRPRQTSSHARTRHVSRCRRGFQWSCAALAVLTLVAFVRVQVTVRATEIAITTNTLRQDIENERIRSEALENNKMSLAAPARIEGIAGDSMGMQVAENVAYLDLTAVETPEHAHVAEAEFSLANMTGKLGDIIASAMRMDTAGKQVLLVGNTGLAPAR